MCLQCGLVPVSVVEMALAWSDHRNTSESVTSRVESECDRLGSIWELKLKVTINNFGVNFGVICEQSQQYCRAVFTTIGYSRHRRTCQLWIEPPDQRLYTIISMSTAYSTIVNIRRGTTTYSIHPPFLPSSHFSPRGLISTE